MPFALSFVGVLLIVTGFQDTYRQFGAQVQSDFTGKNNFLIWIAAIFGAGSIGYIKPLNGLSHAFLFLILLTMIISLYKQNGNVFANIGSGLTTGSDTAVDAIGDPLAGSSASGGSSGSSSDSLISDTEGAIKAFGALASF